WPEFLWELTLPTARRQSESAKAPVSCPYQMTSINLASAREQPMRSMHVGIVAALAFFIVVVDETEAQQYSGAGLAAGTYVSRPISGETVVNQPVIAGGLLSVPVVTATPATGGHGITWAVVTADTSRSTTIHPFGSETARMIWASRSTRPRCPITMESIPAAICGRAPMTSSEPPGDW